MLEIKITHLFIGFGYGVIFCAFLYNLIIYLNVRQKIFLYYCLMQISMLGIYLIYEIDQYYNYDPSKELFLHPLQGVLTNCAIILTTLFSKELLHLKKNLPLINYLLDVLIVLHIIDFIGILFNGNHILPIDYTGPTVLTLSIIAALYTLIIIKDKIAIFFILGWLIIFINVTDKTSNFLLNYIEHYVLFVLGFPLESIVLSFAVGYHLKKGYEENRKNEEILIHQHKLASMGGMIANIAHQWRQPLANISFINNYLELKSKKKKIETDTLLKKISDSNKHLEFMSETINTFQDFYKPQKEKDIFKISNAVNKAINIIKPSLESNSIKIEFEIKNDKEIESYENYYSQIVLNFLNNSKDILNEKSIKDAFIKVILDIKKDKTIVSVIDNGGGIKKDILTKIFDPYFSTKIQGSGIGLYMSQMIAHEHLNGVIEMKNIKHGACFSLVV